MPLLVQAIGSALGVLAANSGGEAGQPPMVFVVLVVGAAALVTVALGSIPIADALKEVSCKLPRHRR